MKKTNKKVKVLVFTIMLLVVGFFVSNYVGGASPVIAYAYPDNISQFAFADTNEGAGANWTVNISDADVDLQRVVLKANSSGSWVEFYNSGALGGVDWHNATGQNQNWTASWTLYYWQICALDGVSWYNTTYTFTTAYQWGEPKMMMWNSTRDYCDGMVMRNDTNDYLFVYDSSSDNCVHKDSSYATDWSLMPWSSLPLGSGYEPDNVFQYNDTKCVLSSYMSSNSAHHYITWYNGTGWESASTGILCSRTYGSRCQRGSGADAIYYNGKWNLICNLAYYTVSGGYVNLVHYTGTFPSNWASQFTIESGILHTDYYAQLFVSLEILDGLLYVVYRDGGEDVTYRTFDGVQWSNAIDIYGDSYHNGIEMMYRGCSMCKDMINNQLVTVYVNNTGTLVYNVFNGSSWGDQHVIFTPANGKIIAVPHAQYIDSRLVVTFSYNIRGRYALYQISAPGYVESKSGMNTTYNRIQFPDASPSATNVNSTIFTLKNVDNRNVTHIDWHFEDIGDINKSSNFKIWTNMSGSWDGWLCDANGDISEIDISTVMTGGNEWEKSQTTWWKVEILAVGGVAEDFHSTDEDIYYKITLA